MIIKFFLIQYAKKIVLSRSYKCFLVFIIQSIYIFIIRHFYLFLSVYVFFLSYHIIVMFCFRSQKVLATKLHLMFSAHIFFGLKNIYKVCISQDLFVFSRAGSYFLLTRALNKVPKSRPSVRQIFNFVV